MVLWHVNSLHLAKTCIGTQKVNESILHSPIEDLEVYQMDLKTTFSEWRSFIRYIYTITRGLYGQG